MTQKEADREPARFPDWLRYPRLLPALVLAVICLAVLLARVLPALAIVHMDDGRIRLLGNDPYYHLRFSKSASRHFPDLQSWDPGTNYPTGQVSDAAGMFNLAIAATSRALALGQHSDRMVERVSAWVAPLCGVATVALLYLLARLYFTRGLSLFICALHAMYPGGALDRTMLGFGDHHCAEMVLGLLVIVELVKTARRERDAAVPWWKPPVLLALPMALLLCTWRGAALHLPILGAAVWVQLTVALACDRSGYAVARASARYFGCLFVWIILIQWLARSLWLSPVPVRWIVGTCLAAGAGPVAYAIAAGWLRRKTGVPAAAVAVICFAAVASAGAAAFHVVPGVERMMPEFTRAKAAGVREHFALDLGVFWRSLGPAWFLALGAVPGAIWTSGLLQRWWRLRQAKKDEREALERRKGSTASRRKLADEVERLRGESLPPERDAGLALVFACGWIWLWIRTHDYGYMAPMFVALLAGFALEVPWRWWARAVAEKKPSAEGLRVAGVAGLAALLLPAWPLGMTFLPWMEQARMDEFTRPDPGWMEAMDWMRTHTPEPPVTPETRVAPPERGARFRYPEGSYGVMSTWDEGNYVAALGNRVPVWSRYPTRRTAAYFVETDPAKAMEMLRTDLAEGEQIRYVVLAPSLLGQRFLAKAQATGRDLAEYIEFHGTAQVDGIQVPLNTLGSPHRESMAARLYIHDGAGLGHYRLVYESRGEVFFRYVYSPENRSFLARSHSIETGEEHAFFERCLAQGIVWREGENFGYYGGFLPSVKIFEVVKGARIRGTRVGATQATALLPLKAGSTGRGFVYRTSVAVAADGTFELVVPYATETGVPGVDVEPASGAEYMISFGMSHGEPAARTLRIAVPDEAIRSGAVVDAGVIERSRR